MRYTAIALDYDGTIAHDGVVPQHVLDGLVRLKESGRKLLLVTGRELPELLGIFPGITIFDRVVAENGALLYRPATQETKDLGDAPPEAFIDRLEAEGVPLSVGNTIVATVRPHETAVLQAIADLGLEYQVIFNKGAVMVLPPGCNKASGLKAALSPARGEQSLVALDVLLRVRASEPTIPRPLLGRLYRLHLATRDSGVWDFEAAALIAGLLHARKATEAVAVNDYYMGVRRSRIESHPTLRAVQSALPR